MDKTLNTETFIDVGQDSSKILEAEAILSRLLLSGLVEIGETEAEPLDDSAVESPPLANPVEASLTMENNESILDRCQPDQCFDEQMYRMFSVSHAQPPPHWIWDGIISSFHFPKQ